MTLRSDSADAARRSFQGAARATFAKADDSKKWQEVTIRTDGTRDLTNIEMAHNYGTTFVPKKPDDDQHTKAAEAIVVYLGGDMSHPIVLAIGDRRFRLQNLQEGEFAIHDDQASRSICRAIAWWCIRTRKSMRKAASRTRC